MYILADKNSRLLDLTYKMHFIGRVRASLILRGEPYRRAFGEPVRRACQNASTTSNKMYFLYVESNNRLYSIGTDERGCLRAVKFILVDNTYIASCKTYRVSFLSVQVHVGSHLKLSSS